MIMSMAMTEQIIINFMNLEIPVELQNQILLLIKIEMLMI